MRKIGGLALVAALAVTGCASTAPSTKVTLEPTATTKWVTKTGEPFDIASVWFNTEAAPALKSAATGIPMYGELSQDSLVNIGRELCEHYASGFTTQDLREAGGESLAEIGEAAKATVCATL